MGTFFALPLLALSICYIAAWILTMTIVTQAAKDKGYAHLNGKLWFIGFFGLIFTPGIIVAALPDKAGEKRRPDVPSIDDELPAL